MKLACYLFLIVSVCLTLHADIHLRGALQRDGKYVVGLWNSHERHASIEWIPVGGTFAGFTVESYDLARDRVRLKKRTRPRSYADGAGANCPGVV